MDVQPGVTRMERESRFSLSKMQITLIDFGIRALRNTQYSLVLKVVNSPLTFVCLVELNLE